MSDNHIERGVFVVSACLIGLNTRYDGQASTSNEILRLFKKGIVVPLCPEILGGLGIPRPKATIYEDRVIDENDRDVTQNFKNGALEFLKYVRKVNPEVIFMKEYSPSCGLRYTNCKWDRIQGQGITTQLLLGNGYNSIVGIE